jgi:hypothetical protein
VSDHEHDWRPFQPWNQSYDADAAQAAGGDAVPPHTLVRVCRICNVQQLW